MCCMSGTVSVKRPDAKMPREGDEYLTVYPDSRKTKARNPAFSVVSYCVR